jgi:hypothetical protein
MCFVHNAKRTNCSDFISDEFFGSDLSPPPSSFGVDLTRLSEPRFFCPFVGLVDKALTVSGKVD